MPYTDPEKKRAHARARYAADPEKYRARKAVSRAKHPESTRASDAAWRAANLEKHRASSAAWSKANPDKRNAATRARRLRHPEEMRAREAQKRARHRAQIQVRGRGHSARWRAANRDKARALVALYAATHPDVMRAKRQRRRAHKAHAPINDFTAVQWTAMQEAYMHCCVYCGKRCKGTLTQDHITPLSKSGSHTLSNIVPACKPCNSRKHAGSPLVPVQPLLLLSEKKDEEVHAYDIQHRGHTREYALQILLERSTPDEA